MLSLILQGLVEDLKAEIVQITEGVRVEVDRVVFLESEEMLDLVVFKGELLGQILEEEIAEEIEINVVKMDLEEAVGIREIRQKVIEDDILD